MRDEPPQPAEPGAPQPSAGTPAARAAAPVGDAHERIDGLRAWIAQLDRRLGIRTYAIGAASVLALAAGIVGVVLALQNRDDTDAVTEQVQNLQTRIGAVGKSASQAAAEQVATLGDRLDRLEGRVRALEGADATQEKRIQVTEDDIDELRRQIAEVRDAGGGTTTTTTTTTTTGG